jgi:hypothetical protein
MGSGLQKGLKRSRPMEAEQDEGVRRLNERKGKAGDWTWIDRKKWLGRNLDVYGFLKF